MAQMKSLAKDTAIYGVSSIVGKFLNYLLVPLYTRTLVTATGEYGIVTNLYAWTALLLVFLTFGMETAYFRFANKKELNPHQVYSTTLLAVLAVCCVFLLSTLLGINGIATVLGYAAHPEYIVFMVIIVAIDAFSTIPFAHLRLTNRPVKFAALKLLFVLLNIVLNLFFLLLCPYIYSYQPSWIDWFFIPNYEVGYILIANLISTVIAFIPLITELRGFSYKFDRQLCWQMVSYALPLLVLGVAGILNLTLDKMLYPFLVADPVQARYQLGIYGAGSKIAMVMMMFTQAFRYAYEPFVFGKSKDNDNRSTYAQAMKYFIIFGLLAFLAVLLYIDLLKFIIGPDYYEGLRVVPIVMMADLFFGIFFNLSFWYKLIDQTRWGAYFSLVGCLITLAMNILLVPVYGYMACAWAAFACYLVMMLLSYFIGQKRYPIRYDLRSIAIYFLLTLGLYTLSVWIVIDSMVYRLLFRTLLLGIFLAVVIKRDFPLSQIPFINRFIH